LVFRLGERVVAAIIQIKKAARGGAKAPKAASGGLLY
jgi:hypothetical protein